MNGISLLLVWASLGVVYDWRPGVDGQQEYILQIEPEVMQQLPTFVDGIQSEVPAAAGNVQRLRIIVLPKDGTPATRTWKATKCRTRPRPPIEPSGERPRPRDDGRRRCSWRAGSRSGPRMPRSMRVSTRPNLRTGRGDAIGRCLIPREPGTSFRGGGRTPGLP